MVNRIKSAEEDQLTEAETARRSDAVLKRLLATPPQPKPKKVGDASPPKKRGRPVKTS
jgi:hypothetical protein